MVNVGPAPMMGKLIVDHERVQLLQMSGGGEVLVGWGNVRMPSGPFVVWMDTPRSTAPPPTARIFLAEHPRADAEARWARALDVILKAAD